MRSTHARLAETRNQLSQNGARIMRKSMLSSGAGGCGAIGTLADFFFIGRWKG
jgi:hypothetical protein